MIGDVQVITTSGRGLTVEELADLALRKIIFVADTCHPEVSEQANQFKEQIRPILCRYMYQAIKSDRTTLYNNLRSAGHPEAAEIILRF